MQDAPAVGPEQLAGETPGTPRANDQGQGMLGGLGQDGHGCPRTTSCMSSTSG